MLMNGIEKKNQKFQKKKKLKIIPININLWGG
jgi:hypothetical protein